VVRDHRSGTAGADGGLRARPDAGPELHDVQPVVTADVRGALRPIVTRCREAADQNAFGPTSKLKVVMTVHVRGGVLGVDDVDVQLTGIDDLGIAGCVHDAAMAVTVKAGGNQDVASTTMSHSFDLRVR
jgi:hypothetical protein